MSEEKSSPIGIIVVVAVIAVVAAFFVRKSGGGNGDQAAGNQQQPTNGSDTNKTTPPPSTQKKANGSDTNKTAPQPEPAKPEKPAEPKEPAFVKEGLVAYYPFNGNAKDESGNGNEGEVKGATLVAARHGKADSAYQFSGLQHIQLPASLPGNGSQLTLSIWAKTSAKNPAYWPRLIGGEAAEKVEWNIGIHLTRGTDKFSWEVNTLQGDFSSTGVQVPQDEWFHVVLVYDGKRVNTYLNGKLGISFPAAGKLRPMKYFAMGGMGNLNEWKFDGLLDDARIYNRALSEEQVKALYEFEKPKE